MRYGRFHGYEWDAYTVWFLSPKQCVLVKTGSLCAFFSLIIVSYATFHVSIKYPTWNAILFHDFVLWYMHFSYQKMSRSRPTSSATSAQDGFVIFTYLAHFNVEYGKKGHKIHENKAFIVFTTRIIPHPAPQFAPLSRNLVVVVRVYLVTFYEKKWWKNTEFRRWCDKIGPKEHICQIWK